MRIIWGQLADFCNQEKYYNERGISKIDFLNFPHNQGLEKGDSILIKKENRYNIGELIVFYKNETKVVHRIVEINKIENQTTYTTKGDKNEYSLDYEVNIPEEKIIGKVIFKFWWIFFTH